MKQLIISFKSRNEIFSFSRLLQQNGAFNSIINTPKTIGSSCMLSIRCDYMLLGTVQRLLSQQRPNSFLGIYMLNHTPYGEQISKIM